MSCCGSTRLRVSQDNGVHIVYGKTLHYVLPTFQPNGRSIYAALADIAKKVNATLSFEKNVIMITDRRPFRAVTDSAIGNRNGGHRFQRCEQNIPVKWLPAHRERDIEDIAGISSGCMFTGITRGVLGSDID